MSTIKYRAACDHCSATKIKCTQERPQCTRCRALGRDCHYSRSLRAGKPPRSSQGLNRKISNAPVLPRQNTPVSNPTSMSSKPEHWPTMPTSYPTPQAAAPTAEIFHFPDLSSAATSSSSSPANTDWFFDFNSGSADGLGDLTPPLVVTAPHLPPLDHDLKHPVFPTQGIHFGAFADLISLPPASPLLPSPSLADGDRCAKLATETLNSLYDMPANHLHGSGNRHPSVDQTLSTCARAVQAIHELVNCSCQKDLYLPMLIIIVASKIVAWYQAVAYIRDPGTGFADGKQCFREVVVEGPLNIGAYQLDDEVGWTLKNQIVLGQLQRLNEAVNIYDRRYCSDSLGGQMTEGGKLYASMVGFVKSTLQFTIHALEGRIRSGHPR
ncbi:C6 zinc cluster transcription factor-like protein [Dothistroma septosporum NZE10]|uniref:Hps1-dma1 cluster transcription factor tfc7 n=1 Tax=Dothistroma septosporum (strain NZE10 / CBS 128990) TaxID=675120 RepID=TFC7_DOTSN|nr:RecName: Full=Hps1-dma1 cluster transcription factor tfc7 [Dothistroma septosporum NZE10]EME39732.1 C6 zinc cluster transcription factor-like protein [Dothistroma septosporum NZE10]